MMGNFPKSPFLVKKMWQYESKVNKYEPFFLNFPIKMSKKYQELNDNWKRIYTNEFDRVYEVVNRDVIDYLNSTFVDLKSLTATMGLDVVEKFINNSLEEKDIETIEIAKVISEIFLISLNPMERQENL